MTRFSVLAAFALLLALGTPDSAAAQSIAAGTLSGRVVDEAGIPIFDADVSLQRPGSGALVSEITDRSGAFNFEFLSPGDYSVRVEAVGYRPLYVNSVPVRPGRGVPILAALREERPPVSGVDTIAVPGTASERLRLGESRWLGEWELNRLPDGNRSLEDLFNLTALAGGNAGLEGLPASMTAIYIDGVRVRPLRLPGMHRDPLFGALVPRIGIAGLEVVRGGGETEWNSGGGVASIVTRAPGSRTAAEGYVDYTGGSLWSSSSLVGDVPEHQSIRGGALVDLPIVPDSVLATFGVEVLRVERPRLALFETANIPSWVTAIGGLDTSIQAPTVESRDLVSAFGRVDWLLAGDARVSLRANVASVPEGDPQPTGYPSVPGDAPLADGRDVSAGVSVHVPLDNDVLIEAKAGLVSSKRNYTVPDPFPYTRIPELPVAVGTHPALPGTLSSTIFELAPTATFRVSNHAFKLGIGAEVSSYEVDHSFGALGDFALGGAQGSGLYSMIGGSGVQSSFSTVSYAVLAQDSWNAGPGLHLLFGGRADIDVLPESDINVSQVYDSLFLGPLASAQRADTISDVRSFGTRFAFSWDVAEENRTLVRGGAGLSYDPLDPNVLHEWIAGDGRRTVATAVDAGTWPTPPATGDQREWVTLAGPVFTGGQEIRRARTARAHFSLTRALAGGVGLHVGTAIRRTENMLRRRDLNLTPQPSGFDQFGRPVFGTLLKRGGSIAATPTFNRRFPGLAQVDFHVFDGWSDYRDVSLALERRGAGPLEFFASYTFSKTEDNMVGWANVDVNDRRAPILDLDDPESWAEGTSDFDIPHRFTAGFSYAVPALEGLSVSGVYRYTSGTPFTPAFRPGVDANGDGSFGNDPAFLGAADLGAVDSKWSCVRTSGVGPVERNACRGDAVQSLDLRLAVAITRVRGQKLELVVDALNVVEPDIGIRDAALYLVDPLASIGRSGDTYDVPLSANPDFGAMSVRQTPGRILRLGLRIAR